MLKKCVCVTTVREVSLGRFEHYEKHLFNMRDVQRWQMACMQYGLPIEKMYECFVWDE